MRWIWGDSHGIGSEWPAALGSEHKGAIRKLPAKLTQRPHLVAPERMYGRLAILGAADMQAAAARPNSTCDHSRSQISTARKP